MRMNQIRMNHVLKDAGIPVTHTYLSIQHRREYVSIILFKCKIL